MVVGAVNAGSVVGVLGVVRGELSGKDSGGEATLEAREDARDCTGLDPVEGVVLPADDIVSVCCESSDVVI